jgi:stress-induced morphogen
MTIDFRAFHGLICVNCIENLENFFKIREVMRDAESNYFHDKRQNWKLAHFTPKPKRPLQGIKIQSKRNTEKSDECAQQSESSPKEKVLKKGGKQPAKHQKEQRTTKFKCNICGKFLSCPSELRMHAASVNVPCDLLKPFESRTFHCNFDGCSKAFTNTSQLNRHQIVHSGRLD